MGEFFIYEFLNWLFTPFIAKGEHPMIFTEYPFWLFFIFVLIGLGFTYKKLRVRTLFLFCVSLYFYYKTSGFFFSILLFSTIVDYFIGKGIYAAKNKRNAQLFLAASITINLILLVYFKYAYFFVDSFNSMLGSDWHPINHFALATNTLSLLISRLFFNCSRFL